MPTEYSERLLIVVTAARLDQANTLMRDKELEADTGANVFHAGLSPTGAAPITHYWTSWQLKPAQQTSVQNKIAALVSQGHAWVYDADEFTPAQVLADRGLRPFGDI